MSVVDYNPEALKTLSNYYWFPATNSVIEIPNVGRNDLADLFCGLRFRTGAEIGTERGLYAEVLCQANPELKLYCIDPYRAYPGYREHTSQNKLNGFYDEAFSRLRRYDVEFLRMFSTDAAVGFDNSSLDFVYIDGNHSLLHVIQDLHAWVPKVRAGGIVAGHDWIRRKRSDYLMHVPQAVTAYCDAYQIKPLLILGSKAIAEGEVRDKPRSWMFVKE